jgi:hypothetical protein
MVSPGSDPGKIVAIRRIAARLGRFVRHIAAREPIAKANVERPTLVTIEHLRNLLGNGSAKTAAIVGRPHSAGASPQSRR